MKSKLNVGLVAGLGSLLFFSWAANAGNLDCVDGKGQPLPVNNAQIVVWKHSTPNQFLARGHAAGTITKLYPDHNGHTHFEITLSQTANETLEVIYNQSFGSLPALAPGMAVDTCGDYITSTAAANGYQASPDGAIIHWIHQSDSANHPSGYVEINNNVFGAGHGHGGGAPL